VDSETKKTILLVEDEAIIAMSERRELEKKGYRVHHVGTGEKAVKTILENDLPVDLILMDIDLGAGIDGTEAAERILKSKDIPIVFLSSHTEPEVVEKTEKITSYGYVVKTAGIVVLDASIKMALKLFSANMAHKQAEEDLYKSEHRFRSFIENANDIIYSVSPDGLFTYISPNWLEFMGEPAEKAAGKSFELYVHPEDVHLCREFLGKVLTTGEKQSSVEYRVKHRDGSWRRHASNGSPLRDTDGKITSYFGIARDITEEYLFSEQLRQRDEQFRSITEAAPDSLIVTRLSDGVILYVNRQCGEMFGLDPSEMINRKTPDFYSDPSDRQDFIAMLKDHGFVRGWEVMLKRSGGESFWAVVSAQVGNFEGATAIYAGLRDATESKKTEYELLKYREYLESLVRERTTELEKEIREREKTEALLRESELKYRNIVDNSTSIILEWDPEGNILYMNRFGLEYFGFGEEEILGKNVVGTIVEPVDTEGYDLLAKMTVVPKNPEDYYSSENENIRRNGEKVWIAWTNKGIKDGGGNLIKTLSLGIDRTRQKQLEQKMEYMKELDVLNNRLEREIVVRSKAEETYRLALEATHDGLWDWDIITGAVNYSPSYFRMLGFEDPPPACTSDFWIDRVHGDDKKNALKINSECIEGKRENFSVEFRMKGADGNWRHILGRGKGVSRDAEGRARRMVGTHTDITALKKSESMVSGLNECFLNFGYDTAANINILVAFLGGLLKGTCALYNRLEGGMLHSLGQWNAPPGYKTTDYPEGHICSDVISSSREEVTFIPNLNTTTYAVTDPNVGLYGLKTYLGTSVRFRGENIGSLCVVFQRSYQPNDGELRLLEIVASAIGVEESRGHTQRHLEKNEEKYQFRV
jgi:PAS domain S-box-containing protein